MYWAKNANGDRVYIDCAIKGKNYVCPHCGGAMTLKRGSVTAHHFAHKPQANCDTWYIGHSGKGDWHKRMQALFPARFREVKVCDDNNLNLWHIADVFLYRKNQRNIVIEFQHSTISRETFWERTQFYQNNGCNTVDGKRMNNIVVWVFDCAFKDIYIRDSEDTPGFVHAEWPGRDRIRFLKNFCPDFENIYVVFYSFKNKYKVIIRDNDFGEYYAYKRVDDPCRRPIFANVISQEYEYRSFDAEQVEVQDFAKYVTNYL